MAEGQSSREATGPFRVRPRQPWMILVACCLASGANLLEPPIWVFDPPGTQLFDAAWNDYRLIASLGGVLLLAFLLLGGVLGDLYGRRRIWLVGLAGSVAANLALMVSANHVWHIVLRFCMMAFGAVYLPLVLATLNLTFADRDRTTALAIYTVVNAIAVQLAWVQGQFLSGWFGWRATYVLPLLLALVAFHWTNRFVPETQARQRRQLDIQIYSGWTMLVLAIVYGSTMLPVASDYWGVVAAATVFVGLTGAILVFWWNVRRPGDVLRYRSYRVRDLTALIVTGSVIQFLLIGFGLRTLNYFQVVRSMSVVVAVLALAPMLIGLGAAVYLFLRTMHVYRARLVIAGGLVVMALSMAWIAWMPSSVSYWIIALPLMFFGVGYLVSSTIWTSAFLRTAVAGHLGVNAAITSATTLIGGAVGSALTGNLLAAVGIELYVQQLTEAEVNVIEAIEALIGFQTLVRSDPAYIAAVTEYMRFDLVAGYIEAYALAYRQVLWLMVAASLVAALLIGFGLRSSLRATVLRPGDEELNMA